MISQLQKLKPVMAIAPATQAGGSTGKWISLKNIPKVLVEVVIAQGASNTVAITIEMAPLVNGAGNTAITEVVPIFSNLDTGTNDDLVKRTRAVSYTTDAGTNNKVVVFEIDADRLDAGYDCINVNLGSSSGSNLAAATYWCELRYSGADTDSN